MASEEIPTIFFSGKSWKKNLGDFLLPPGYDFIQPMGRDGSDVNACYSLCEIVRTSQCVGCDLCCVPKNTSRVAPWSPDCNSPVTIGESKGAGRCFP